MTAREMFIKLGYEHIVFNLKNKTVKSSGALTIDEIKAVYQQCKELDWIEKNAR